MPDLRRILWMASQVTPVEAAARLRLAALERAAASWRPFIPQALPTRPVFPAFRDRAALAAALDRAALAAPIRAEAERVLAGEFTLFAALKVIPPACTTRSSGAPAPAPTILHGCATGGLSASADDGRASMAGQASSNANVPAQSVTHFPDWLMPWPSGPRWTTAPSFEIDISGRDGRDVRVTWELSRCQDVVTLARAAAATGEARFAERAGALIVDWLDSNPFLRGPNWRSALEVALRAVAWVFVDDAAPDPLADPAARRRFTDSLYLHALYVDRFMSRGLNPSNHIIGEAAALFVLGHKFRSTQQGRRWRARSARILEEEAARQTYASGASREHAVGYHRFVAGLFALCLAVDRQFILSRRFRNRVASMYAYLNALARPDGSFARLGDSDEAVALRLSPPAPDDLSADLALAAALFPGLSLAVKPITDNRAPAHRQAPLFPELDPDSPRKLPLALWLLGPSLSLQQECATGGLSASAYPSPSGRGQGEGRPDESGRMPNAAANGRSCFASPSPQPSAPSPILHPSSFILHPFPPRSNDANLFVLRSPSRLLQLEFDSGPHGFSPVSSHGHADALSLTLWRGGARLVDAGTYRYNGAPAWRDAFRSTQFHNSLCVDGLSQAVPASPFRWKTLADAAPGECFLSDEFDYASGTLPRGPARPWSHRREVLRAGDDAVFIIDSVACAGRRRAETFWHFGDAMLVTERDCVRAVYADGEVMTLASLDGACFKTLAPSDDEDASPVPAWRSPHYGVRVPSASAVADKGFDGRATLAWTLAFGGAEPRPLALDFGAGTAVEVLSGPLRRILVVLGEPGLVHLSGLVYFGRWGLFEFDRDELKRAVGSDARFLEYNGKRLRSDIDSRGVSRIL